MVSIVLLLRQGCSSNYHGAKVGEAEAYVPLTFHFFRVLVSDTFEYQGLSIYMKDFEKKLNIHMLDKYLYPALIPES